MSDECKVIYVSGLARMLGRTEASVREGIRRGVPWLPKGFKMGVRHCWLRADVMQFLTDYREGRVENKLQEWAERGRCHLHCRASVEAGFGTTTVRPG